MRTALSYLNGIVHNSINEPMFFIYTPTPPPRQIILQRFWFPYPEITITEDVSNKQIDSLEHLLVL